MISAGSITAPCPLCGDPITLPVAMRLTGEVTYSELGVPESKTYVISLGPGEHECVPPDGRSA